jgi:peroxiredoxin
MDARSSRAPLPDFSLPASTGQTLSQDSFRGKVPVAIVFLAGLDENRDLVEAMNAALPRFGSERAQILGVAPASADGVQSFAEANDLAMPILADSGGEMVRAYGGDTSEPWAVIIDAEGREVRRFDRLADDGVPSLLAAVKGLGLGTRIDSTD